VLLLFRPFPTQKDRAREALKTEVENSAAEAIEAVVATGASRAEVMAALEEDPRGRAEAVVVAVEDPRAEAVVAAEVVQARAGRRQPCFGFRSPQSLNSNPSL
jgi:hypothetical protein